ncbi:outer membrane adhesin like proteiin : Similarity to tr/Q3M6Y7_ANAVT Na-Ca exchanger/integrin-beta4 (Fragment) OS=Microcystis aeruginosa PCC 7806 GN=IPF_6507 PE=4 SV=1: Calx-beta [Gemmataceae bacterium]
MAPNALRTRLSLTSLEERVTPAVLVTVQTITAATESGTTGVFRFTRTGSTASALTASFLVGGTATQGSDYTAITSNVTFAAGSATADKIVTAIDDGVYDPYETVTVQVGSSRNGGVMIAPGTPGSAAMTIGDNDTNAAPQIINFTATHLGGGLYLFTGQVTDDQSAAGRTVTFGGVPTMVGKSTTTASDGTFSIEVQLLTNGDDDGTVTAYATDIWGLTSDTVQVTLTGL